MKKWVFTLPGAMLVLSVLFHGDGRANVAEASDFTVQLTSDLPSGQPVSTLINWSVTVEPPGNYDYRLSYARYGEPLRLMYDFQEDSVFEWSLLEDGAYAVVVTVRNRDTGETAQATRAFFYAPRTGSQPLVSASGHPLVALYSAPPCAAGNSMRVVFWRQGNSQVTATDKKACDGVHSMNFYIAGMYPISFYWMKHKTFDAQGQSLGFGPNRYFVTGVILYQFLPPVALIDPPDENTKGPGCPPVLLDDTANDWTHSNSVTPTPDGHMLLSIRHQDWVVKINYANGTGDGAVLWRLYQKATLRWRRQTRLCGIRTNMTPA